jgi:mono/diheme cytochrome c family protein
MSISLIAASVWNGGAFAAYAAKGEVLAKRWCVACHVVAESQRAGNPDVPSFASIGSARISTRRRSRFS